jgi:hypothetical protein
MKDKSWCYAKNPVALATGSQHNGRGNQEGKGMMGDETQESNGKELNRLFLTHVNVGN